MNTPSPISDKPKPQIFLITLRNTVENHNKQHTAAYNNTEKRVKQKLILDMLNAYRYLRRMLSVLLNLA
jgi:hypothetical protein